MSKIFFGILIIFLFGSCDNVNKSSEENSTTQDTSASDSKRLDNTTKSRFNGDSLKYLFSKAPFNYTFKDERTIDGTSNSHVEGYENESSFQKDIDVPNEIVINYDFNSRKATSVTFYLNHFKTNNIKMRDCRKLVEFIDFFDSNASKYLKQNFNTIFYDEAAKEKLNNYKTNVIEMFIDHNLFDARKFDKNSDGSTTSQYVDCIIKF
ncbi:hypothetical protein AAFN85_09795 [Mucilaginibacter sp. CAU 1740]|uniref:hypothetical protein n=1 Tax=Mucilaginibacter sp. CAU 1740 TaxID=3140365 RepID=UPI00325A989E